MNTHGPKEPMPTMFPSAPVQNVGPGGQMGSPGTNQPGSGGGVSPGYGNGASAGGSFGPKK